MKQATDAIVSRAVASLEQATSAMEAYRAQLAIPAATSASAGSRIVWLDTGGDMVTKLRRPLYTPLCGSGATSVVDAAERAATEALTRCGVLEHAALATASDEDIALYMASLRDVDAALAKLWEARAVYALAARSGVDSRRQELAVRIGKEAAEIAERTKGYAAPDAQLYARMRSLRGLNAQLREVRPAAGAVLDVPLEPPEVVEEPRRQVEQRDKVLRLNARVARKVRKLKRTAG